MEVFRIGGFTLRLYSVMIMLGLIAGAWLATREARRRGEGPGYVLDALIFCVPLALIGARLYHVVSSWDYYRVNPSEIPAIWHGGIGIYGAVVGSILGVYIFTLWRKQPLFKWLDIGAAGLLLGQAIGRWGNYLNQELYGPPTDAPWGIYIAPENRLDPGEYPVVAGADHFHPLFFYEFIWNLLGVAMLLYVARKFSAKLKLGDITLLYGIVYPLGRFMLETYRFDAWKIAGFPTAQWVSLAAMVICGALLLRRHVPGSAFRRAAVNFRESVLHGYLPRIERQAAAWAGLVIGVAAIAVSALLVSENVRPFLVELTGLWALAGLVVVARITLPVEQPAVRRPRR